MGTETSAILYSQANKNVATPCLLTTTYHCVQESSSWPPSGQTRSCSLAQRRPRWLSPHLPQQSSPWEMLSPTPSNGPAAFVWADLSYRSERYLVSTFMKFQKLAAKIRSCTWKSDCFPTKYGLRATGAPRNQLWHHSHKSCGKYRQI